MTAIMREGVERRGAEEDEAEKRDRLIVVPCGAAAQDRDDDRGYDSHSGTRTADSSPGIAAGTNAANTRIPTHRIASTFRVRGFIFTPHSTAPRPCRPGLQM